MLTIFVITVTKADSSCDSDGWVKHGRGNSCYKFVISPSTWSQANGLCLDMGGSLATLNDDDEIYWMRGYRSYHRSLRKDFFWIGGYKKNDQWLWKGRIADTLITHSDWSVNMPGKTGDCMVMFGDGSSGWLKDPVTMWFKWATGDCSAKFNFICEKSIDYK
ncbi:hypothetical protein EB796_005230 [Bugula neritina]|uniref:C-type lectin domain-containing protein n=1 Tax=Bugula neritina TaxID=10212 RepID=A0A7J7KF18_BUGNE|nr:hypothetical protein EB796_005230 [Bugula neritina]